MPDFLNHNPGEVSVMCKQISGHEDLRGNQWCKGNMHSIVIEINEFNMWWSVDKY